MSKLKEVVTEYLFETSIGEPFLSDDATLTAGGSGPLLMRSDETLAEYLDRLMARVVSVVVTVFDGDFSTIMEQLEASIENINDPDAIEKEFDDVASASPDKVLRPFLCFMLGGSICAQCAKSKRTTLKPVSITTACPLG